MFMNYLSTLTIDILIPGRYTFLNLARISIHNNIFYYLLAYLKKNSSPIKLYINSRYYKIFAETVRTIRVIRVSDKFLITVIA